MKKQLWRLAALALLLAALLGLAACHWGEPDDLGELASSALGTYTTTAPSSPDAPTDPLTVEELGTFLSLVDFRKVERAEACYEAYYIGDYRPVSACFGEMFDTLSSLPAIRTVTDPERATGAFIEVYARLLGDYYGYYYPPTDYSDYTDDIAGKYTGIGVSVLLDADGYAEIINVFPGSPAEEVGMLPGDVLIAVGGEDFAAIGYQNAIDRIRGAAGTTVSLTVRRDGAALTFTVPRREVTEVTVESRMMEGNIGYIRIISFNERTYQQFVTAHRALDAAGAVSYVFDLRNNPGGTLNAVVAIAEYILPEGPIVHLNYKNDRDDFTIDSIFDIVSADYMDGEERVYYANHAIEKPMVVLANGSTASAGELFTSSLNDYGVATVIGDTTYGKGVGQTSFYVANDGSAITMTIFSYDPPTSPNYDGVGITPDIAVSLSEEAAKKNLYKLTYAEDTQLQAAVAALTPAGAQ